MQVSFTMVYTLYIALIQVARLFPSSKAIKVEEFSAYRSLRFRRYGFTMAVMVKLMKTTTQADIAVAYQRLTSAGRIGGHWLYLGNRHDQSLPQGMRAFVPSSEYTNIQLCLHMQLYKTYTHMHTHVYMCMHVFVYVCARICVCVYDCVCICTHTYVCI